MTPLPRFLFGPGDGGCLLEVPRLPRPPIRTLLCLLAHFLPCLRLRRLAGGEEGTDLGALHADDKVKESFCPLGTSYLSRVFNTPQPHRVTTTPSSSAFKGAGWLITVIPLHNQRDCVVLFAPLILSLHGDLGKTQFLFLTSGPVGQQLKIAAFPSFRSSPKELLLTPGPSGNNTATAACSCSLRCALPPPTVPPAQCLCRALCHTRIQNWRHLGEVAGF